MADAWKYILLLKDVYQDPVLNTKEADVANVNVGWIRRVYQIRDLQKHCLTTMQERGLYKLYLAAKN